MKFVYIVAALILLASCGGGSSSSDQPSGVTYNGSQTGNLVSSLVVQSLGSIPFLMVVTDNNVFITDTAQQPVEARGTISGDRFTARSNSSGTIDGATCSFDWTYSGRIEGDRVSGSISGPVTCSGAAGITVFNTSGGTFAGVNGNSKALANEDGVIYSAIRSLK